MMLDIDHLTNPIHALQREAGEFITRKKMKGGGGGKL